MTTNTPNYPIIKDTLHAMLEAEGIPHEIEPLFDGYAILFPCRAGCLSDVVIHKWSYGHLEGLWEMAGATCSEPSDVDGYLSAETVVQRWKHFYLSNKIRVDKWVNL